jgi:hypothetical protein
MRPIDVFVVVAGSFSIVTSLPLIYLAVRGYRDGRELRRLQSEVVELMGEVREIQDAIHHDQRRAADDLGATKLTVERVATATARRRRLPRVRVEFPPTG